MKRIISTLSKKWPEYLLEVLVIVVGILVAFGLNNWQEKRKQEQQIFRQLKIVHDELGDDINVLEEAIIDARRLAELLNQALEVMENEITLNQQNRDFIDSALNRYKWMDPLFNNSRSFEEFLLSKSNFIEATLYSKLNEYIDIYDETSGRIKRFAETINHPEYDVELRSSIHRNNAGKFVYEFDALKEDHNVFESLRLGKAMQNTRASHYGRVLDLAKELKIQIGEVLEENQF